MSTSRTSRTREHGGIESSSKEHRGARRSGAAITSLVVGVPLLTAPVLGISLTMDYKAGIERLLGLVPESWPCSEATLYVPERKQRDVLNEQLEARLGAVAVECLALYDKTEVALVDFTGDLETATLVGEDIQRQVRAATRNLINVDITVLPASDEAQEMFDNSNRSANPHEADCIPRDTTWRYSSFIADQFMPEVKSFDKVMGYSALTVCHYPSISGIALADEPRYAEIFGQNLLTDGFTGAHELLHKFRLGHSGVILNDGEGLHRFSYDPENPQQTHVTIDLDEYIRHGDYDEYGSPSIMGNGSGSMLADGLDPVQRAILDWPNRFTDRTDTIAMYNLRDGEVAITSESDPATVIVLPLRKEVPVTFSHYNDDTIQTSLFNTLTFTPYVNGTILMGVRVGLANRDNNVANLGPLLSVNLHDTQEYQLHVGGEEITVRISLDKKQVELIHNETHF